MEDNGIEVLDFEALGEEAKGNANFFVLFGERVVFGGISEEEGTLEVSGDEGRRGEGRG